MNIFRSHPGFEETPQEQEVDGQLDTLETRLGELRQVIIQRRTILQNAEKKLQEFQDTIYAMLIEEESSRSPLSLTKNDWDTD